MLLIIAILSNSHALDIIKELSDFNKLKANTPDVRNTTSTYTQPEDIKKIQGYIDGESGFDFESDTNDADHNTIAQSVMRTAFTRGPEFQWSTYYTEKMRSYATNNNISPKSSEYKALAEHFFFCFIYAFYTQQNAYKEFYPGSKGVVDDTKWLADCAIDLGVEFTGIIGESLDQDVQEIYRELAAKRGARKDFIAPVTIPNSGEIEPQNLTQTNMQESSSYSSNSKKDVPGKLSDDYDGYKAAEVAKLFRDAGNDPQKINKINKKYLRAVTPWRIGVSVGLDPNSSRMLVKEMDSKVVFQHTATKQEEKKYYYYDIDELSKQLKINWGFTGDLCYLNPKFGIMYVLDVDVNDVDNPFTAKYGFVRNKFRRKDDSQTAVETRLVKIGKPSRLIEQSEKNILREVEEAVENALVNNNFIPFPPTLNYESYVDSLDLLDKDKKKLRPNTNLKALFNKLTEVYSLASLVVGGSMTEEGVYIQGLSNDEKDESIADRRYYATPGTQYLQANQGSIIDARFTPALTVVPVNKFKMLTNGPSWQKTVVTTMMFSSTSARSRFEKILAQTGFTHVFDKIVDEEGDTYPNRGFEERVRKLSESVDESSYLNIDQVKEIKSAEDVKSKSFMFLLSFDKDEALSKDFAEDANIKDHQLRKDYASVLKNSSMFAQSAIFQYIPAKQGKKPMVKLISAGIPSPVILHKLEKMKSVIGDFEFKSPEQKAREAWNAS